jgi:hypothetical protein
MPTPQELTAVLDRLIKNDRVALVRIAVPDSACPVCRSLQGVYPKDKVPRLPPEGCSCPNGQTRDYYEPVLTEVYP